MSFLCSRLSAGATAPLPGELFTQSFKSAGYTIACTLNWLSLFVVGMVFPVMVVSILLFWSIVANVSEIRLNSSLALMHICPPSFPGASAGLLFPHISVFLYRLWAVCEVQRPRDQESNSAGDCCSV